MWFYAFNCFGSFLVTDGYFKDFMILVDSSALPQSIGFYSLYGLRVSYGIDLFFGKLLFCVVLCFRFIYLIFFFRIRDGQFIDFVILLDSIALSRCIGI